jgi:hypothetical protein
MVLTWLPSVKNWYVDGMLDKRAVAQFDALHVSQHWHLLAECSWDH